MKLKTSFKGAKSIYNDSGKEIKQNIIDNDCRRMRTNEGFNEAYNAQASACIKNGLLTSCDVSNYGNDVNLLDVMIEKNIEQAPQHKKDAAGSAKYIADNGYYSVDNLIYCRENEIDAYIPGTSEKKVYIDKKKDLSNLKRITSKECSITIEDKLLRISCPGKQELVL